MDNIPEGYKKTELGTIPIDWNLKKFEDVMTGFSSGATPYRGRPEYYRGEIRWITSGELNYNVITDTIEKITESAVKDTNLKIHPKGTFLMAITGLEAEGTRGRCGIVGAEATTNQSCMALFPTKELLTEYLFHYYVNHGNSLAFEYCQGTKQQSYTGEIAKILPIILPPTIEEQQAIASALTDMDALITALEQLITKKRNIKQGAMQQLLTGKKRLPGFSGEWEVKKLGKLLDYEQPTKYIVKDIEYNDNNDTPVLTAGKTLILGYTNEETGIFRDLPVIIFDDFTTANKYVSYPFKVKSSAMKILKPKNENINLRFVFEKMQLIIFHLGDHKRYWISEYQNLEIDLPPFPEQQAIATILTDMDSEIEALEQKRDKYKALKQGMMQELLTGKTRLV